MDNQLPKIGQPATRALNAAGVYTLEQVANVSDDELLKLHGVGVKAIRILRQAIFDLQTGDTR